MYKPSLFLFLLIFLAGCGSDDDSPAIDDELTGEFLAYEMVPGPDGGAEGKVYFYERQDGGVRIELDLEGTVPGGTHPAHLHYGEATTATTLMAAMLTPVDGDTGISETEVDFISENVPFTYEDVSTFDGHIKVHLDAGAGYDTTLALGNVGINASPIDGE